MDIQHLRSLLEQQKDQLRDYGLRRVGIFGSQVRGEGTKTSDIDVLLDFDPKQKTYRNFYASTTFLERLFDRPVDAVTPQGLSPYIKPYIERETTYVQITE